MSIYPAKLERRAKFTAALLAVVIFGAIAICVGLSHDRGYVPAASNSIGNAARTELLHEAVGRNSSQ